MLSKRDLILKDLILIIDRLKKIIEGVSFEEFTKNIDRKEMILYNLIILGEGVKNLVKIDTKFKDSKTMKFLIKNRNNLTHQYWISSDKKQ